jgi:hypothetical protein
LANKSPFQKKHALAEGAKAAVTMKKIVEWDDARAAEGDLATTVISYRKQGKIAVKEYQIGL